MSTGLGGRFKYFFENLRVRVQEEPEGANIKVTLLGPSEDIKEAIQKYLLAYPPGGYNTALLYEGEIVKKNDKKERVAILTRYSSCD